jgi:hypothetical protein
VRASIISVRVRVQFSKQCSVRSVRFFSRRPVCSGSGSVRLRHWTGLRSGSFSSVSGSNPVSNQHISITQRARAVTCFMSSRRRSPIAASNATRHACAVTAMLAKCAGHTQNIAHIGERTPSAVTRYRFYFATLSIGHSTPSVYLHIRICKFN